MPRVTPQSLHGYLATGRYDVLHFIGHAHYEEGTGARLLFEDDSGRPYPLDERSAREIFCRRGLRLVFLNACQTGAASPADFNRGLAQSLVAHGLPALVANQYSVLDRSATTFAQHFYWGLARGFSLGEAAREARIGVNYSLGGEAIDWAVPVVYAHDPDQRLRQADAAALSPRLSTSRVVGRRSKPDAIRVGLWDVDGAVSGLAPTLAQLNAAQQVFEFAALEVGAPLDLLKLEDGERYLSAEWAAERLAMKVTQLGLDLLVCVTSLPLRDAQTFNLYAWWPDLPAPGLPPRKASPGGSEVGGHLRVAVLSHFRLEALRGDSRALANSLVTILAGYFGAAGTHDRGPKGCPLYFNPKRDADLLRSRQRFDRTCAAQMTRALGADAAEAIDALLGAFDAGSTSPR